MHISTDSESEISSSTVDPLIKAFKFMLIGCWLRDILLINIKSKILIEIFIVIIYNLISEFL